MTLSLRPVALRTALVGLLVPLLPAAPLRGADLPDLFAQRVKSCVTVEFLVENELDRQPVSVLGVCVDANGTIILPATAIGARVSVRQLKDFKVYLPDSATAYDAEYLGQDVLTGWHFVRAEEKIRSRLVPITAWVVPGAPEPRLADQVWGIGLRGKDEDFRPYFLMSRVGLIEAMPQLTAIAATEVAGPGLPVFDRDGALVGLALNSFGQNYLMFSRRERGQPVVLVDVEESSVFLFNREVLPYLHRIPRDTAGRPLPWLGAFGLEPVAPDVAKFLQLENQSALVVSEVLENSPAEKAGLKGHDIIVALNGQPLPRLKPDQAVVTYLEREIDRRLPGDQLPLTVLRDGRRLELDVTLGDEPKIIREADRRYFERLGLTVREFLYGDGVARRVKLADQAGVIVDFVKPNSPAAAGGVEFDDWIRQIDGKEIKTYADAVAALSAIEADKTRADFVLLTSRDGETAVRRVKLQ
ncbi:MAG TPA: PDZ domain-containing protein [Opitutaceae bacterium]|nr:PDZ domain-containing protein [Opitutaceae bacterium]